VIIESSTVEQSIGGDFSAFDLLVAFIAPPSCNAKALVEIIRDNTAAASLFILVSPSRLEVFGSEVLQG
jgi:hypothetical protein